MCFNWKNINKAKKKNELKIDEIKKIFNNFFSLQQLTISGGEPFLRDDLPEILEFISHNNDVQMITIPTNGILSEKIYVQTKNILKKISQDTHLRIALSVEGIGKEHDNIVQVKGAFKSIQNTYHKLHPLLTSYENLNIDIAICCSSFNKKNIKKLLKYSNEYFKDCTIELVLARGDARDPLSKRVSSDEYKEILDYFYNIKNVKKSNKPFSKLINLLSKIVNKQVIQVMDTSEMPSKCYSYSKMIVIQSNGNVLPCEYLGKKLGNLREYEYDIKNVLKDKKNIKIKNFIKDKKCFCTWECALINNIVCNAKLYPLVLIELIKNSLKK
jgi:radical SAM protein with 4Fe4S-binding SPASM domain